MHKTLKLPADFRAYDDLLTSRWTTDAAQEINHDRKPLLSNDLVASAVAPAVDALESALADMTSPCPGENQDRPFPKIFDE
jgi:hypothetical protein